jgi:biopolymer transport protein ExbD
MGRRRKKRQIQGDVELNLAAMLDMAFQLLSFFIFAFRPAPLEGQISLRMPPPQATVVVKDGQAPGEDTSNTNPMQGMNTLTITVYADQKSGSITGLGVQDAQVGGLPALAGKLKELFSDPGNPFEQVIIQVSDACRYDELMKVIDICTHQKLPGSDKLPKLSFVELPGG